MCESLALTEDGSTPVGPDSTVDRRWLAVPHVHGTFPTRRVSDSPSALAALGSRWRGTFAVAMVSAWFTFAISFCLLVSPGWLRNAEEVQDPASLLLALPLTILGVWLGVKEHPLSSAVLDVLRLIVLVCATLLFVGAMALAWHADFTSLQRIWRVALAVSGLLAVSTGYGAVARIWRRRTAQLGYAHEVRSKGVQHDRSDIK